MKKPNFIKAVTVLTAATMVVGTPVTTFCAPIDNVMVGVEQQVRKDAVISDSDKEMLKSMFDAEFFAKKYPEVAKVLGNDADAMFLYFVRFGIYEGKQPCASFDVASYATAYKDLAAKFGTDVVSYYRHFVKYGKAEGRNLTTVEACKNAGIDTKIIEAQRFSLNEEGAPVFVKFYDPEEKAFVYSEPEARIVETGTFSDYKAPAKAETPAVEEQKESKPEQKTEEEKKKEEKQKKEVLKYQQAYDMWMSKMPQPIDYMTTEEKAEYYKNIEELEMQIEAISEVKIGRAFKCDEKMADAYDADLQEWVENNVNVSKFLTDDAFMGFVIAFEDWLDTMPVGDDYMSTDNPAREWVEAADEWVHNDIPDFTQYSSDNEYLKAVSDWVEAAPSLDSGRYISYENCPYKEEGRDIKVVIQDVPNEATLKSTGLTQTVVITDRETEELLAVDCYFDAEDCKEIITEDEAEESREALCTQLEGNKEMLESPQGQVYYVEENADVLSDDMDDWSEYEPEEEGFNGETWVCPPDYPADDFDPDASSGKKMK